MHQLPEPTNSPSEFLPSPATRRDKGALPASYTDAGYSNAPDSAAEPESGGLIEYLRILRRRKAVLLLIAVLGAVVGFLVTLPQTPIYQVRTSLEVVALNQDFLNSKESNPLNEGGGSVDAADIQTQIKILQSDSLIARVLAKLSSGVPIESRANPRAIPAQRLRPRVWGPGANSSTCPTPRPPAPGLKPFLMPRKTTKSGPPARPVSSKSPSTP